MLKRVIALCLALALISAAAANGNAATQADIDSLESQKEDIADKKSAIAEEIAALESQQSSIMQQKAALDKKSELTQQEIGLINEQIDIYASIIMQKEKELEAAIVAEEGQKKIYRKRIRAMEEAGPLAYLQIIFSSSSFSDMLTRIDVISEIMEYDSALEAQYVKNRENTEILKAEYEELLEKQEEIRIELLEKQRQLEKELEEAVELLVRLQQNIEEYEAVLDEFEAEAARIQQEIDEKVAELEKQQASQGQAGGIYATGSLNFPLQSWTGISYSYGNRLHPILGYYRFHAGEDISAPQGTPIYASDGGTVITATYGGGYGNYVSISHGNGMTTLYAHMTSFTVAGGQAVSQGDLIGYVGSTGLSTGPHLHFEVTVDGQYQNPMSYFGM